ncbi:hypothetical protein G5B31_08605 [Rhodobacter sp. SGA-6-6]|uniref:transglycosylase domain-containing protein n=1 Tax=Rhodobacter sp. SGA-6-6 TaxID=2710882 RepID=UPI0013EDDF33|nr:transglycosylase domain-containing protein [Rhodobacter sp. SGA-6-6]NGM45593.1 hypothetical protein [Rhodobacter sp. SGA-6-6]
MARPALAQQEFPDLEPGAIRSAYEAARAGWTTVPESVKHAFLVAEDKTFRRRAPSRSTITASIASWYPEPGGRQSFPVAIAIARALAPDEILDWFVHGSFLGQGCFGAGRASQAYFGKEAARLDLHEAALLAALVADPAALGRDPARVRDRRNYILSVMAEEGFVPREDAEAAALRSLSLRDPLGECLPE